MLALIRENDQLARELKLVKNQEADIRRKLMLVEERGN
jgi:hypothetical protein